MAPESSLLSHQPSKEKEEESSSGEEEEEEGDESEDQEISSDAETEEASSGDEGGNQETLNNIKSPIPAPKFDSRFDSDCDSGGSPSDYLLQPIHKGSVPPSKRSRVESKEILDSLKSCKRSRIDEDKHASSSPGAGVRVGCINRLWGNDDEIAMLNGMIEFKTVKGLDPGADLAAFYSFIKGKFQVDFTRDQLRNKIGSLKKRFLKALKKGEKGSDPVFSKPHEVIMFEISKKIWGGAAVESNAIAKKKNQKVEKDVVDEREVVQKENGGVGEDFWSKYPNFKASFDDMKGYFPTLMVPVAGMSLMKERLSLIGNVKAKEFDDKWKQLGAQQTELSYKILMLMKEQVQMALDQ